MAYVSWGDPANPKVVVCVHGLTRCSRDFDDLARQLAKSYRVICPDIVGRGQSDWLRDPQHYQIPQYCADVTALLAKVDGQSPIGSLHWVGTSMGGLIGMALAAQVGSPIERLVLNDVGPVVTAVSVARIGEYLGKAPRFQNIDQAEAFVRAVSASFGPLSDAQWRHLTTHVVRDAADGLIEFCYDPAIAQPFRQLMQTNGDHDMELWPVYDAIRCPTLLLRGELSDLLMPETADAMTRRGPKAQRVEVAGVGHAPALMAEDQIATIEKFLLN